MSSGNNSISENGRISDVGKPVSIGLSCTIIGTFDVGFA